MRTGVAFAGMAVMTSVMLSDHMVIILAIGVLQATTPSSNAPPLLVVLQHGRGRPFVFLLTPGGVSL